MKSLIFDKIGNVTVPGSFEKTYPVSVVKYSQFGAVGDGETDDFAAIYNTHVFANQSGQKVIGDTSKTYFIKVFKMTVPVRTDVDWNGANFFLDDTDPEVYAVRNHNLFTVIIDTDGTLNADTPVIWDFEADSQYLNNGLKKEEITTPNFTRIEIYSINEKPLTLENGTFYRRVCATVSETGYENIHSYARGIKIERSNVTMNNITHRLLDEPIVGTSPDGSSYGFDTDGKLKHSYPYGGFFMVSKVYNFSAINCNLSAHTLYWESKSTSSTPVGRGSYDVNFYGSTFNGKITIKDSVFVGKQAYKTKNDPRCGTYYNDYDPLYIFASGYIVNYKGEYNASEASTFPYLKWDFGYTCYLPQDVVIENLTTGNNSTALYLYNDIGNAAFEKPVDFVQPGDDVDRLYYNQYQLTKKITYRNQDALIQICPNASSILYLVCRKKEKAPR